MGVVWLTVIPEGVRARWVGGSLDASALKIVTY
jgi:hypothetical protein